MMENFEKYIKDNKAEFDTHRVDKGKLWANIESQLDKTDSKPKVIKLWSRTAFKVAATIVIALGLFTTFTILNSEAMVETTSVASQELVDIDTHYKALVAYQVNMVNASTKLTESQKKEFLSFMDELDAEYTMLRKELSNNIDNERVLEAIVINYKKRIEIIENLLKQINSSKKTDDNDVYIL